MTSSSTKGSAPAFWIAKRARYRSSAGFTYRREGCVPIDLGLSGAALDLYFLGTYEPETLDVMASLARGAHTFLDIGAQAGTYSLIVAAANPSIEVFAFEADPTSVEVALENVRRNAGRAGMGSIRVCAAAVDEQAGLGSFRLAGGNSSLNDQFRTGTEELLCPKISIDSFLDDLGHRSPVDLVKIDTETTEPAVLRGMTRTIERWRPTIALEVLRGRTEGPIDEFVSSRGYTAIWLRKDGHRVVERVVGDRNYVDLNYLLVPEERVAATCARLGIDQQPR